VSPDVFGILNKIKSKEVARLLELVINVFKSSLSNEDVFVIFKVWVIPVVHPVEITPELMFSRNKSKSKSKIYLV